MNFIVKEFEEKIKALIEMVSFHAFDKVGNEIAESKDLTDEEKDNLLSKVYNKYVNKCCHELNYNVFPGNKQQLAETLQLMRQQT